MTTKKTIFKTNIVEEIARTYEIPKLAARELVDSVFGIITDALEEGHDVKISNFFNFFVKELKSKNAINPFTKEPMIILATRTVHTRMTKPLKNRIQGNK